MPAWQQVNARRAGEGKPLWRKLASISRRVIGRDRDLSILGQLLLKKKKKKRKEKKRKKKGGGGGQVPLIRLWAAVSHRAPGPLGACFDSTGFPLFEPRPVIGYSSARGEQSGAGPTPRGRAEAWPPDPLPYLRQAPSSRAGSDLGGRNGATTPASALRDKGPATPSRLERDVSFTPLWMENEQMCPDVLQKLVGNESALWFRVLGSSSFRGFLTTSLIRCVW